MASEVTAKRLRVNGIVQGVGFRPFVFQLAEKYSLNGEVANTSSGVTIHIQGPDAQVTAFEADLTANAPPLAYIVEISGEPQPIGEFNNFAIVKSKNESEISTLISPDVSVCDDCRAELFAPHDRRYRYPFINCTNCGPRYTIIDDIPYDRPMTSMRHFQMCAACQAEYDDPANRRFHAQPNACAECGPHVALYDSAVNRVACQDSILEAATLLKKGYILAVKGLGGYHLAADAANADAVRRLRDRKMREEKPFAVMAYDSIAIRRFADLDEVEEEILTSIQRPIVLLRKKASADMICPEVAPRNKYFGVMLPYTPLHYLLLEQDFTALVMTSANLSEEPIAIDNEEAFKRLGKIADYFLVHNRDIYLRSDDSIVRYTAGSKRFFRRSRGFVPVPVFLRNKLPQILACGAELKNTVCLTKGDKAFLSQHIGDLENALTYDFFRLTVRHLKRILDIQPEVIACDLHPDYLSTRYAEEQRALPKVRIQHHHAHIVSGMAEHKLDGEVIGLAFDGTGLGTDNAVWGGEILIAETHKFERAGHLGYVAMPGSTAAIKEPWRMAISYLQDAYGPDFVDLGLPVLDSIGNDKLAVISQMINQEFNSPMTSSLGRLFDGVAAICGIRNRVNFEGQAAMELEMLADDTAASGYDCAWERENGFLVPPAPIIRAVVADVQNNVSPAEIGAKFHLTLVQLFSDICDELRREYGLDRVVLSGGCFQNATLLSGMIRSLQARKFDVYSHEQVPTNDGGISLGQAVVAAAVYEERFA